MPDRPTNPPNFWLELKRRKVIRVITVYAAAAFAILELLSIIIEPLRLPEWTLQFAIVFLCIGFIVAIILSWIYDITPEGIEKTKPADEITEKEPQKLSGVNAWKIATFVSIVIVVGLIIINIIGRREKVEDLAMLDKSVAVLPFKSLSDDPEKQYLADGAMDAIILHLSKIADLRVVDRTSVEQYRKTDKTATTICQELDVAYLLEGSFQKYGDQARLIVQLIKPSMEGHIWANEYDRNWKDIFSVQSEVAQTIAKELHAVITPEEKKSIEKKPTINLTAYDYYQRGREELIKCSMNKVSRETIGHMIDDENRSLLERAEILYHKALEFDTTFALAYSGLAWIHYQKQYWEAYLSETYLDSVLILANIALSYNNQLSEAYTIMGQYYRQIGNPEQATKEFNKALEYNPNNWLAYYYEGLLYWRVLGDYIKSISNMREAIIRHRGEELPDLLYALGRIYLDAGFIEKAKEYYQESFKLGEDSILYFTRLGFLEFTLENFNEAVKYMEMVIEIDSTDLPYDPYYTFAGHDIEAYNYYGLLVKNYEKSGSLALQATHRIGYAYWKMGKYIEAEHFFNEQIKYGLESIRLGRDIASWKAAQYDLAATYSFLGKKERAYEYLDEYNTKITIPLWWISLIKHDPLFNNIRDEERFQKIVQDMVAKYQAEHERVRQWLEENDML